MFSFQIQNRNASCATHCQTAKRLSNLGTKRCEKLRWACGTQSDNLIDTYFKACGKEADEDTRTKIYCYIAACGLLWSNWCEYKSTLGVEFGEYSLRQYRYAKDFYKLAAARIGDKK